MKLKDFGRFLIIVLLFFAVTSPIVVLFGPFDNIKRTVVGAILKSRHPQYITWLYSQEEIDQILGGISTAPKQELFKFKVRTDSSLKLQNIESSRFKGFLLEIPDPKRVKIGTAENMDEKGDTTVVLPSVIMLLQPLMPVVSMMPMGRAQAAVHMGSSFTMVSSF